MITLTRIGCTTCPSCHSPVIGVEKKDQHCNGEWNEYARYQCGAQFHYSPNMEQVEQLALCPKSLEGKRDRLKKDLGSVLSEVERSFYRWHQDKETSEIKEELVSAIKKIARKHLIEMDNGET